MEEKRVVLETVGAAGERSGLRRAEVVAALGIPLRTERRWRGRAEIGDLADGSGGGRRERIAATPDEEWAVVRCARAHPLTGYKRLAWLMVEKGIAGLRPYQVLEVLHKHGLVSERGRPPAVALKRPAPPERPDEVWHIDLMYVWIGGRWYYLVDILDSYSRYLVHWSLNATMHAETVTLTVQEAVETLPERREGEPRLVHDHGSQFVSAEWRGFVMGVGATDIATRIAHPESNGRLERLHRTHREEGLIGGLEEDYPASLAAMTRWQQYYNHERPHSALRYLRPIDYYRGDPEVKLVERETFLARKREERLRYWQEGGGGSTQ